MKKIILTLALSIVAFIYSVAVSAQGPPEKQKGNTASTEALAQDVFMDADGTVHIRNLAVPLSPHMSEEAKRATIKYRDGFNKGVMGQVAVETSEHSNSDCPHREKVHSQLRPVVERAKAVYPVNVEEQSIAGVRTDVVTPQEGIPPRNRHRVLLNVHGGGYGCATSGGPLGLMEAIPIAGVGKFKVITIDYRTSPKYKFPAATEDVAAIYRHLLKSYKSKDIGIYGCSTGATLSAGALAWFQKEKLPRPGAVGLFGDGATKDDHVDGDSWFVNHALVLGKVLAPSQTHQVLHPESYMEGTEYNDPLVAPVVSLEVLSRFPPSLVISGTRDIGLSEAVYTHSRLVKAGAETSLHVWEGMGHCFFVDVDLPESKDMFDVTAKFFDRNLGRD